MATAHTYYVAHRGVCLGERASSEDVCNALTEIWQRLAPAGVPPTPVDGVSVWRDDAGKLQLRIIRNATAEALADPEALARLASALG